MPASILIVEDEWLIAEDYASALRDAGHAVVGPCPTVKTALAAIGEAVIDAAILDMDLRGEKSFPVAERLKGIGIPFAFFSGNGIEEMPCTMRDEPLLSKPVERQALLKLVRTMCPQA